MLVVICSLGQYFFFVRNGVYPSGMALAGRKDCVRKVVSLYTSPLMSWLLYSRCRAFKWQLGLGHRCFSLLEAVGFEMKS